MFAGIGLDSMKNDSLRAVIFQDSDECAKKLLCIQRYFSLNQGNFYFVIIPEIDQFFVNIFRCFLK